MNADLRSRMASAFIVVAMLVVTPAAADGQETTRSTAASAEAAYQRGIEAVSGSSEAEAAFVESAETWKRAIDAGADGPAAWFNLGNARMRAGEIGPAILAYRRAERLAPTDDDIAANLAEARQRVDRPIQADATDVDFASVAGWWHLFSTQTRLWIGLVSWVAFWILLDRRRAGRGGRTSEPEAVTAAWRAGIAGTLVIALLSGATVAADRWLPAWRPVGVVVQDDVIVRSGNGISFEPAIEESLSEGVEFAILEERPGWWRVRLPDGTQGWISQEDGSKV